MSAMSSAISFRPLRLLAAAVFATAVGVAVVQETAPERKFGQSTVAADVEVRVVPRSAPTAETVRREALSRENLAGVYRRLKAVGPTSASPDEAALSAAVSRWRRQIVIEVHSVGDPDRRRIRFLYEGGRHDVDAPALIEATATRYAEILSADRWYRSVDRLRVAEEACDDAIRKLSDAVTRVRPTSHTAERREGPKLLSTNEPTDALRREMTQLVGLRAQLMETLQPAHPQIVAVDTRLSNLQAAAAAVSPIRRLSAESEMEATSSAERDPIESAGVSSSAEVAEAHAALTAAAAQLVDLRGAVRQELNVMLDPAAAEFPVVIPVVAEFSLWSQRETWYALAAVAGLFIGLLTAISWRRKSPTAATIELPQPESIAMPVATTTTPARHSPAAPERVSTEPLRSAEQVSTLTAAPILAELRRRRPLESLTHA